MGYKIGIDVGGTFIDLAVVDPKGKTQVYKSLSNPADLAGAVLAGLETVARNENVIVSQLLKETDIIIHGSTVTTNALLTRTGARTALLTTEGFRDVLNMRRGMRQNQYDPRQSPPDPLIPRQKIYPIGERIDCEGAELTPVNEDSLDAALHQLSSDGIESVAVAFLFSFFNSAHEDHVAKKIRAANPKIHVSLSCEVLPEVRLYERVSTTAVNAYVSPVLARYLESLEARLQKTGFAGKLLIMQSNGGVMGAEVARQFGVRSILSGPAAGPVAGIHYANPYGISNVITIDMGGTSFDVCLVRDGDIEITKELQIAGYRIALPLVAVHTIGAGGGSIVKIDSRGLLQVGPESAGASPGPVCYGGGGRQPTVTDADLLVGYLDPDRFWGGRLRLNTEAAREAFREIATPLGMDATRAAYGAYQVVNANMVDAIREVSVRRGHDPRQFLLVAAGGAGPIHASAIAGELDIPLMLVPRDASVMCAVGQLLSDLRHDFVRSYLAPVSKLQSETVNRLYGEMKTKAVQVLLSQGIPREKIVLTLAADARYIGQFNEVEVPLKTEELTTEGIEGLVDDFHARHEALNGYSMQTAPVEIVNLRVVGRGIVDKPATARSETEDRNFSSDPTGYRKAFFSDRFTEVPVYDGMKLPAGSTLNGPAIVEEETTTVIVQPGYNLTCDNFGNYLVYRKGMSLEESIALLRKGA
ncbi:MAG TPA: hydantoinase/oxoprolinase family protein [Candidatus Binatia bacterium]|jgi:N-methylhydantoinase A